MNQRICKQLRRQARALTEQGRAYYDTQYIDTPMQPKQCGFHKQMLPSGTPVTIPFYAPTIKRTVQPDCQRGVYLKLKQQVQHPL